MQNMLIIATALGLGGLVAYIAKRVIQAKRRQRKEEEAKAAILKAQKPVLDWLDHAAGIWGFDTEALAAIEDAPDASQWPDLTMRVDTRMKEITEARKELRRLHEKASAALEGVNSAETPVAKFELALKLRDSDSWRYLTEEDQRIVDNYLKASVDTYVEVLLEEARNGDRNSFITLDLFTKDGRSRNQYWRLSGHSYIIPEDWDELVVRFYKTPHLDNFRFVKSDTQPDEVRLMAAEALEKRSLRKAQIVLAFCNQTKVYSTGLRTNQTNWPWREAIGDVLLARLAKMVHELQIKNSCILGSEPIEA